MANWSKNKTLPADVNNGNEFLPDDGVYSGDINAAFNNAFYAVDYATALADTPDTSEAGNVGTPSVSLIDNVKDGKTYKKFKFANLKGATGKDGKNGADGAKGETGLTALEYGDTYTEEYEGDIGDEPISLAISAFNRTPVVGDKFLLVYSVTESGNTYTAPFTITQVSTTTATASLDGATSAKISGKQGATGDKGETGNDGEPALAYGAAISLTTDTPSEDISLPNLTFNRTPKRNDLFTAVASSSTNSYQVVYKIITEGSPQSTARPQSYVVTTGKQLSGGASLDGNNVFTGTNTFNQPITADTVKNSNDNEIAEWDGTKQNFGSVDVPTVLRTSETNLKLVRPKAGSTTQTETVTVPTADEVVDLTSYQEIAGDKTFSGNVEMGAFWVKDGKVQIGSASGSQLPVQLGSSVGEENEVFVSQGVGKTPKWAALKTLLADIIYPVGAIYMTTNSANPSTMFPNTTWVAWGSGRVPVGVDVSESAFISVEKTGGEITHTLTTNEMPKHKHTGTGLEVVGKHTGTVSEGAVTGGTYTADFTLTSPVQVTSYSDGKYDLTATVKVPHGIEKGGNSAHNNLQPYITCFMWKRTA